jgi:hypothetical protein
VNYIPHIFINVLCLYSKSGLISLFPAINVPFCSIGYSLTHFLNLTNYLTLKRTVSLSLTIYLQKLSQ